MFPSESMHHTFPGVQGSEGEGWQDHVGVSFRVAGLPIPDVVSKLWAAVTDNPTTTSLATLHHTFPMPCP